ncbi:MAG: hypothetical protein WC044_08330 [Crocinitomicaceae bacterium]
MKFLSILLPFATLLTFSAKSQDTLSSNHCNCVDIIENLTPSPNGMYKRICDNVLIEKGAFLAGAKTGEWLSYSTKGNLIKKITYTNGTLNGELSYYYNNGKMKLSGRFSDGLKTGDWKFYNQKEKIQWSQTFHAGIPTGKSFIYDPKGKKVVVSYDYDKEKYDIYKEGFSLFKEKMEVLQDPTSSGWFILMPTNPTKKNTEMSLDQTNIESELFFSLIEIPSEIFNTYTNVNYNIELTFEDAALKSVDLKREAAKGEEYPMFTFAVLTNDPDKLSTIEHSEFTLLLLDAKIKEALSIFTPWKIENGKFKMAFLYVINQIEGRDAIDK